MPDSIDIKLATDLFVVDGKPQMVHKDLLLVWLRVDDDHDKHWRREYWHGMKQVQELGKSRDLDICCVLGSRGWWTPKPAQTTREAWWYDRTRKQISEYERELSQIQSTNPRKHSFVTLQYHGQMSMQYACLQQMATHFAQQIDPEILKELRTAYSKGKTTYKVIA